MKISLAFLLISLQCVLIRGQGFFSDPSFRRPFNRGVRQNSYTTPASTTASSPPTPSPSPAPSSPRPSPYPRPSPKPSAAPRSYPRPSIQPSSPRRSYPQPSYPSPPPSFYQPEQVAGPAQYSFEWKVEDEYSGNNYGHEETRDDKITTGKYFVSLPDGRIQTVTYTVDGYGGYQAEITYEGEAQYPPEQPQSQYPQPQQQSARPRYPQQQSSSSQQTFATQSAPAASSNSASAPIAPAVTPYRPAPSPTPTPTYRSRYTQPQQPTIRRYSYRPAPAETEASGVEDSNSAAPAQNGGQPYDQSSSESRSVHVVASAPAEKADKSDSESGISVSGLDNTVKPYEVYYKYF